MKIWKDVKGYEGIYQVSNYGRLRTIGRFVANSQNGEKTLYRKPIIKKQTLNGGYLIVTLNKDGKFTTALVHRLVAAAFVPGYTERKNQVNHKDEDKTNNRADNLEWCDARYNINYGTRTARAAKTVSRSVMSFDKNGRHIKTYESLSKVKEDGYNPSNVKYTCDGKFSSMYGLLWKWAI